MNSQAAYVQELLSFIRAAEKLKTELRHSWTSDPARQESVAEHSWMLSLLAVLSFGKLRTEIDRFKVLKMIIVHDCAEALTGDIPAWETGERKDSKAEAEENAMEELLGIFSTDQASAKDLRVLFREYEEGRTPEAKIVKALDKIEAFVSHNIASIATWIQPDFDIGLRDGSVFDVDPFIRELKTAVDAWTLEKASSAGMRKRLKPEDLTRVESLRQGS